MKIQEVETPILKGVSAKRVLKEINTKANKQADINGKKLVDFFNKIQYK